MFEFFNIYFDGTKFNRVLVQLELDDLLAIVDNLEIFVIILGVIITFQWLGLLTGMVSYYVEKVVAFMVEVTLNILDPFYSDF